MLIQMRSKVAKIFMFVLFGLLIMSFAVWGIGDIFRGGGQYAAVANVGDTEVNQQDFSRSLTREMNLLRQRFGGQFDMSHARAFGIVDQVIQRLVTNALFQQQAKDLGLATSEAQIKQRILEEPAFQNELGGFERGRFRMILNSSNMTEQQFVETLGRDIERQIIVGAIVGATDAPQNLAEALYRFQQERRVAETILVPRAALPEDVTATDEQLEEVYRANTSAFLAPEYRAVTYLHLAADEFAKGISIEEEVLREEFEARRSDYSQPERRTFEQIVLSDEGKAKDAKARLAAGEGFAEVSQAVLGRDPVDLGQLTKENLGRQLPDLVEAAFALGEEEVSDPVKSPFGWHLLRAVKIEPSHEPAFEEVREELSQDLGMREAVDSMIAVADSLDDELAAGATIEEAAQALNLTFRSLSALAPSGQDKDGTAISGLPSGPEFLQAAFDTEAGETSLLTETRDGNYFVIRVDDLTESETRPLAEVRDQVVRIWENDERDRRAKEKATALAERAREGIELAAIADEEKFVFSQTDPLTRERGETDGSPARALAARLFEMSQNDIEVVSTDEGQVVTKLIEIEIPDPGADQDAVERVREGLGAALQDDLLAGFISEMQGEFGVQVNDRVVEDATSTY